MDWIGGGSAFAIKTSTGKIGRSIASGGIEENEDKRMKIEKQFKKVEKY